MKIKRIEFSIVEFDVLKYVHVIGNSGKYWFYPQGIENPGDYILVTDSKDWEKRGEGFGGSTINLSLMCPPYTFELRGGWHSDSAALLNDTGINLTDKHLTYGAVVGEHEFSIYDWSIEVENSEVFYSDIGRVVGEFDRLKKIGKELATLRPDKKIYVWIQSTGGGSFGIIHPD